jgi:hypothetical protein
MSDAMAVSSGEEIWQPKGNPWIIAVAVSLAAFMEVLDTSIANVALPHIAGNLGASNDESTWVLTSYLVSNAIVLPISGWPQYCVCGNTFPSPFCSSPLRLPATSDCQRERTTLPPGS